MTSPYRSLLDVGRRVEVPRFPFKDHLNDRPGVCFVRLAFDQARQNVVLLLAETTPGPMTSGYAGDADLVANCQQVAMQILDSVLTPEEQAAHRSRVILHSPKQHNQYHRDSFALIADVTNPVWAFLSPRDIIRFTNVDEDFLTIDPLDLAG